MTMAMRRIISTFTLQYSRNCSYRTLSTVYLLSSSFLIVCSGGMTYGTLIVCVKAKRQGDLQKVFSSANAGGAERG